MKSFIVGLIMGTCDIIPGISGGTVAFVGGIYDRLIGALRSCDVRALRFLFSGQWKSLWKHIDGAFLSQVLAGILIAIISLAKLITRALATYPAHVRGLFWWLLIGSVIILSRPVPWDRRLILWAIWGAVLWRWLSSLPLVQTEPTLLSTSLAGMFAIMAMILPGISGSYILLMLNHYHHIISVLNDTIQGTIMSIRLIPEVWLSSAWYHFTTLPWGYIIIFILGAVIWLLAFSKILHWLTTRYHHILVATLIGVIIWSLKTLRPWKQTISTITDRHGELQPLVQNNILPDINGAFWITIGLFMLGLSIVLIVYHLHDNASQSANIKKTPL